MSLRNKVFGAAGALIGMGLMASVQAAPLNVVGGPVDDIVFTDAGLSGTWNFVPLPEIFGTGPGANGQFVNGGTATYVLRSAAYGHKFGVSDSSSSGPSSVIFDTTSPSNDNPVMVENFTNPDTTGMFFNYVFFFQTLCSNCSDDSGKIFSDGVRVNDGLNQLDMAIYQQGDTYAFFFDDGGPSGYHEVCSWEGTGKHKKKKCTDYPNDDNDYNDMVVTISLTPTPPEVPEPMTLGLLGLGLAGLGVARRRRKA